VGARDPKVLLMLELSHVGPQFVCYNFATDNFSSDHFRTVFGPIFVRSEEVITSSILANEFVYAGPTPRVCERTQWNPDAKPTSS